MEKGIIEQFDELISQKETVESQKNSVLEQQLILHTEKELFNLMKMSLLKDIEKKVWELVNFFLKVWKLKS